MQTRPRRPHGPDAPSGRRARWLLACVVLAGTAHAPAHAAASTSANPAGPIASSPLQVASGYHRSRQLVTMRDGARLDTFVLAPEDTTRRYPILLVRTPYDPGARWMDVEQEFLSAGYVFVTQSVRGRYGSEGRFVQMRPRRDVRGSRTRSDESTDAFDTIDWLLRNVPNNNGRVGLRGVSYNGFYVVAGMLDAHPALRAASPQAPQADWFAGDDVHHNGAFLLASTYSWLASFDHRGARSHTSTPFVPPTDDGYRYFLAMGALRNADATFFHGDSPEWRVTMRHGSYDRLWQQRNILPHIHDVRPAVLVVSGWYDANNLYGALHVFEAVRAHSPATGASLVLGPWTHGQWATDGGGAIADLQFGAPTATEFIRDIELPFFEAHLKGDGRPDLPVARVFDTGRHLWRSFDAWPPKGLASQSLYLQAGQHLGFAPAVQPVGLEYDEYVSDPAHPVPFVPDHGFDMDEDYMARDQRFSAARPDVLVYQSDPLREDVTVIGPIAPHLIVSTSGSDSDWVVKVIDVHEHREAAEAGTDPGPVQVGGFQELVRGDVLRGKFRHSLSAPRPMPPGRAVPIDFVMPDVYHTFKKGHRIMVQVQSSWFPLVDRNPQQFMDIYAARDTDFHAATQRVYRGPGRSSRIDVGVLPAQD